MTRRRDVSNSLKTHKTPRFVRLRRLILPRVAVGWADVEIGPNSAEQGNTRVTQHSANLRILSEATTVTVDSCRLK